MWPQRESPRKPNLVEKPWNVCHSWPISIQQCIWMVCHSAVNTIQTPGYRSSPAVADCQYGWLFSTYPLWSTLADSKSHWADSPESCVYIEVAVAETHCCSYQEILRRRVSYLLTLPVIKFSYVYGPTALPICSGWHFEEVYANPHLLHFICNTINRCAGRCQRRINCPWADDIMTQKIDNFAALSPMVEDKRNAIKTLYVFFREVFINELSNSKVNILLFLSFHALRTAYGTSDTSSGGPFAFRYASEKEKDYAARGFEIYYPMLFCQWRVKLFLRRRQTIAVRNISPL